MIDALGLIEIKSWSAAMAALDAAEKAAPVRLLQLELNDLYGVCIKLTGSAADVEAAISAARGIAKIMNADVVTDAINAPDRRARSAYDSKPEFSPLIEQDVVFIPREQPHQESRVSDEQMPFAIGMIETQGLTAVIEAIDTACKAAAVEVIGKEKLGGGYVTVLIRGDVAAVKAAVEAGQSKVEGLGKLIAAHVIARPSAAVMSLLPTG
jgi:microcompartment protein CcmL/EutN